VPPPRSSAANLRFPAVGPLGLTVAPPAWRRGRALCAQPQRLSVNNTPISAAAGQQIRSGKALSVFRHITATRAVFPRRDRKAERRSQRGLPYSLLWQRHVVFRGVPEVIGRGRRTAASCQSRRSRWQVLQRVLPSTDIPQSHPPWAPEPELFFIGCGLRIGTKLPVKFRDAAI